LLREIYRQFPPPLPDAAVRGSAGAIEAGKRACGGRSPLQVKARFLPAARESLTPEQAEMVAAIETYAHRPDAAFTAGQLAADVYRATLGERLANFGYQGCVYALARGLERRLAPR
jgi:hypothetical protein